MAAIIFTVEKAAKFACRFLFMAQRCSNRGSAAISLSLQGWKANSISELTLATARNVPNRYLHEQPVPLARPPQMPVG